MTTEAVKETSWTSLTPSGIEVKFQSEPKRQYWVRAPVTMDGTTLEPEHELIELLGEVPMGEWRPVPSVTEALDVLHKPGLPWWGMKVGVEGVITLFNRYMLHGWEINAGQQVMTMPGVNGQVAAGVDHVVELLKQEKLTVNHVRDTAGVRGVSVHDALETFAKTGEMPEPSMFPPEEQGYVRGLVQFLSHIPSVQSIATEVMVGSIEHGFAGRYDWRFKTTEAHKVVKHRTPVRGAQWAELPPGEFMLDLKTSSDVYPSHHRQLEGYEGASIECGYGPTDARGILNVDAEGNYKFVRSRALYEDFLCVLRVWQSDRQMADRK